jgi:hypothetical protein
MGRQSQSKSLKYVTGCEVISGVNMKNEFQMVAVYWPMLGGSHVTTAWRVLRLRMEETASRYGE